MNIDHRGTGMLPGDIWRAQGALGGYDSSMVVDEMNVVAIERLRMTGFFFSYIAYLYLNGSMLLEY